MSPGNIVSFHLDTLDLNGKNKVAFSPQQTLEAVLRLCSRSGLTSDFCSARGVPVRGAAEKLGKPSLSPQLQPDPRQGAPLILWSTICPDGTAEQGRGSWKNAAHPGFPPCSWGFFTFAHNFSCTRPSSLSRLGRCCPGWRCCLMLKGIAVPLDRSQGAGQRAWGEHSCLTNRPLE